MIDCKIILSKKLNFLNFKNPIVGIHIRRTDKLIKESCLYEIEDYMTHVNDWYDHYEKVTVNSTNEK